MIISELLKKNIINIYGEKGQQWLTQLPHLLPLLEERFQITLEPSYSDLSFHYVAPVLLSDGQKAVLKCGVPDSTQVKEAQALIHFNGLGCVKLYKVDYDLGVLLLEKADPGITLEAMQDQEQACLIAIDVMRQLHKPLIQSEHFETLSDWFAGFSRLRQRFQGKTGPFPETLLDKAEKLSQELIVTVKKPVLLHGDLHYGNILSSATHEWIAIDPKGVIGEAEFEMPLPRLGRSIRQKNMKNQIDRFIELSEFDRQRTIGWLFSKAVLAAWWSFEDNGEIFQPFIDLAKIIDGFC